MMMSSIGEERGVVCVTGASGFIASWVVKLLLESGYTARATVGDVNDPKKTQHLLALDGAKERLHLFRAELTEAGSFDSALNGCEGIFHTASPVICSITMFPTRRKFIKLIEITKLLDSAVKGTLNVLRSCTKAEDDSSKEKARELGVEFTPLEVSVRDTVESLKEKGCFKP